MAGCLVERYRDEIRKNIPEVDAVVGTGELDTILAAAGIDWWTGRGRQFAFQDSEFDSASQASKSGVEIRPARRKGLPASKVDVSPALTWDGAIADLPELSL